MTIKQENFSNINRSALIINPKSAYYDWCTLIDHEFTGDEPLEGTVYLLPDFETEFEIEDWLEKNFDLIFADQLNNRVTDPKKWPKKRNYEMFHKWYEVEMIPMVLDVLGKPIKRF